MDNRTRNRLLAGMAIAAAALGAAVLARRPDPEARERAAYPPLDKPKRLAENLWIVDSGPINANGVLLPVRMTVIRLASGDLLLHSPTRFTPDLARALGQLGRVRHLVAPSFAHWTFVADWQRMFPDATSWAVRGLTYRAQVKASGVRFDAELEDTPPPAWADEVRQGIVRGGGGFAEAWLFHRPSRTLVLTDLVQQVEPDKLPSGTALVMRAARATRGETTRFLRPALWLGGRRAREAIRAVIALEPDRVVFAHGRLFEEDGARQLRQAFAWLV